MGESGNRMGGSGGSGGESGFHRWTPRIQQPKARPIQVEIEA
jgi:hypothetical protein